jgi:HSP20 family protein
MDVSESDAAYTVVFDVPGASREQLKVSVEGKRVVLSTAAAADAAAPADAKEATAVDAKQSADKVLYRERPAVAYARTVVLPAEVDQTHSHAKFENGVLTLTLAKKVPAGATQLSIA